MKFKMGYYVTAGNRWCVKPQQAEVASWTDLDVYLWRQFDAQGDEIGLWDLRQAVKWSVNQGRSISLDLDMGYATVWKRQIRKASRRFVAMPLTNPWDSVSLVDVADEVSPELAVIFATGVRRFLLEEGLRVPPIGATFSYQFTARADTTGLDWIGLEAYLDADQQNAGDLESQLYSQLFRQAQRLATQDQKIVVILQAYSRNGGWRNMETLAQMQQTGAAAAVELFGDRLLALKLFSWERPSGTKSLPREIRTAHQTIWNGRVDLPPAPDIPPLPAPEGAELWVSSRRAADLSPKLHAKLQENIWAGARDWEYVLAHCSDCLAGNPLQASAAEISTFVKEGYHLDGEGADRLQDLGVPHWRYPDRVAIRKTTIADFIARLDAHLDQAHGYRANFNGQPGEGVTWNSAKGWCEQRGLYR